MVPQGLAHFSERIVMRISCVTYKADIILLNCHMCSSVDMWEKFLSRFRPSCIKCGGPVGDKKAPLLQFSPLLLPTLPKFAHFAHLRLHKLSKPVPHLEDGGDFESKTSIQLNVGAFYHTQQTEDSAVAVEFLRFYLCVAVPEGVHMMMMKIVVSMMTMVTVMMTDDGDDDGDDDDDDDVDGDGDGDDDEVMMTTIVTVIVIVIVTEFFWFYLCSAVQD